MSGLGLLEEQFRQVSDTELAAPTVLAVAVALPRRMHAAWQREG